MPRSGLDGTARLTAAVGLLMSGAARQTVSCAACQALHDVDVGVNLRGRYEGKDDAGFTAVGSNWDFASDVPAAGPICR